MGSALSDFRVFADQVIKYGTPVSVAFMGFASFLVYLNVNVKSVLPSQRRCVRLPTREEGSWFSLSMFALILIRTLAQEQWGRTEVSFAVTGAAALLFVAVTRVTSFILKFLPFLLYVFATGLIAYMMTDKVSQWVFIGSMVLILLCAFRAIYLHYDLLFYVSQILIAFQSSVCLVYAVAYYIPPYDPEEFAIIYHDASRGLSCLDLEACLRRVQAIGGLFALNVAGFIGFHISEAYCKKESGASSVAYKRVTISSARTYRMTNRRKTDGKSNVDISPVDSAIEVKACTDKKSKADTTSEGQENDDEIDEDNESVSEDTETCGCLMF